MIMISMILLIPSDTKCIYGLHRVRGQSRNVLGKGVKWAVSPRVWPAHRRGDSGTGDNVLHELASIQSLNPIYRDILE